MKPLLAFLFALSAIKAFGAAEAPPRLGWAPPPLENPITIILSDRNRSLKLEAGRDYILKMPAKVSVPYGISINGQGARHIVLIGGEIDVPHAGDYQNTSDFGKKRRALNIVNWTGTFHLEGLWIHGEDLAEGIDVDTRAPGAALQIQNVRIDDVHSRPAEIAADWKCNHHPDIIQNWGGPTYYRIDRLTGSSDYQGLMMQPIQYNTAAATKACDFRNMNLRAGNPDAGGAYLLFWIGESRSVEELRIENVWLEPRAAQAHRGGAFPEFHPAWKNIRLGAPPEGDFVPEGVAGVNYISPGYRTPNTPEAN